jgi:NADPH:quinone reductase-like Zn-dependent oxidoreductase
VRNCRVKFCPGSKFPVGTKVAALMGGVGRTINGSCAEYTRARASNVALIESGPPWAELSAIPETYATAWTCLFRNLEIKKDQLLFIRGATSSFDQAGLKMAVNPRVRVIATSRNRERFAMLEKLGVARCEIERRDLSKHIAEAKKIDAVLDLVGNTVMRDSLAMLRHGGHSCLAGWLGGLDPLPDFDPLLEMASGAYLTFFGSFVFGTPGFPIWTYLFKRLQRMPQRVGSTASQPESSILRDPRGPSRDGGQRSQGRQDCCGWCLRRCPTSAKSDGAEGRGMSQLMIIVTGLGPCSAVGDGHSTSHRGR